MDEPDNKTIMCSVLFLDIVGYSKKSVMGQISLKERFNTYLSSAIADVPITDRIILDTGDGAAINFIGDVEDALKAALGLRESLCNEDPNLNHPLLVRMGINLGPVRLVRDINGQPNIVGDGINVAQRVMGFAEANQVLVSRSYYDAVFRLSPQYAGMFHYRGSRTDKHVREHEVYAIGSPGGKDAQKGKKAKKNAVAKALDATLTSLKPALSGLQFLQTNLLRSFERAGPVKRVIYAVFLVIGLLAVLEISEEMLLGSGTSALLGHEPESVVSVPQPKPLPPTQAPVTSTEKYPAVIEVPVEFPVNMAPPTPVEATTNKLRSVPPNPVDTQATESVRDDVPVANGVREDTPIIRESPTTPLVTSPSSNEDDKPVAEGQSAFLSVTCLDGAEVFVGGKSKGKMGAAPLVIPVTPGRHLVVVSHEKGMDWKIIKFRSGVTVSVNPDFCK
jgi:hypothetical protein